MRRSDIKSLSSGIASIIMILLIALVIGYFVRNTSVGDVYEDMKDKISEDIGDKLPGDNTGDNTGGNPGNNENPGSDVYIKDIELPGQIIF